MHDITVCQLFSVPDKIDEYSILKKEEKRASEFLDFIL